MRDREEDRHWQPPPRDAKPSEKMGWIADVVACGEDLNASLSSAKDLGPSVDMISGRTGRLKNQSRSDLTINRGKRALREVNANIADIRAIDAYSSDNPQYQNFLGMLNKIWKAVWFQSKFPTAFKRATQWLSVGGYSFISPVYRNLRLQARSAKAIDFDVYSCMDCLPFQLPDNYDVQGAYAWTRVKFMPEYEAHAKFPKFQHKLKPVARRRYSGNVSKERITLAERLRNANNEISSKGGWTAQMDEIRYTTVRDLSINDTKKPIPMGRAGSLESYVVPFLGQELPTNEFVQPGIRKTRKAEEEDCFLYPNLRLFISQTGMDTPMYDGPFFDCHGMHPLSRFSADEWPWEPGYSLAREIFSVDESRQSLRRGMEMTARQRFDPGLMYDKNAGIPRKTMETLDPYEERLRLGVDGEVKETTVRTILPKDMLTIEEWAFKLAKLYEDDEDYLLGLNAFQNLARAKVASGDKALEKAQEEAGPIAKDISHGMGGPMEDLMMMVAHLVFQYYPTGRVMAIVGPDGVSREVFDFRPEELIPSHGYDEDAANGPSIYTKMERIKNFFANIQATIPPGSLHVIPQTQQKLLLMQLQRSGFPIDPETLSKAVDIPDWGVIPGNTIWEKWQYWQKMQLEFAERMKELATALAPPGGAAPTPGSPHPQGGRPPSGHKPPNLRTKGSAEGPRATIVQS
jgi:hypothetical protein